LLFYFYSSGNVEVDTGMTEQNFSFSQTNYCFSDLAPLYALDLLNDDERRWIEQQIANCPELAEELTQYQIGVTAIPYGAELGAAAGAELGAAAGTDLGATKAKLFDRLNLDGLPSPPVIPPVEPPTSAVLPFAVVRSENLRWTNPGIPKVEVAILHIDRQTRERVGLLRAEAGMSYPAHRHGGTEEIYMLSGDLNLEGVTYRTGDYIRSSRGSHHGIAHSESGCMFYFRSSTSDQYPPQVISRGILNAIKNRLAEFFQPQQ
jgi:quercetin dioxygenase-like cupin family protein